MSSALSTLTLLVGIVQISPTDCQFELLHPDGTIDTHQVKCELILPDALLPIDNRQAPGI
jgi:hypothetical protein